MLSLLGRSAAFSAPGTKKESASLWETLSFGPSVEIRSAMHGTADTHPGTATVHRTVAIAARLPFSNLTK